MKISNNINFFLLAICLVSIIGYGCNPENEKILAINFQEKDYYNFQKTYTFKIYRTDRVAGLIVSAEEYSEWNDTDGMTNLDIQKVSKRIYEYLEDDFEFIFIVSNNGKEVEPKYSGRFFHGNNQVKGIGKPIVNNAKLFGSSGRLIGVIHMPYRSGLRSGPSLHELMHAWGNDIIETSLHSHWGFSNIDGQLGGFSENSLIDLGENKYQATNGNNHSFGEQANYGNSVPYSELELYLMGMVGAGEVPPISVAIDAGWIDHDEGTFTATGFMEYTIENIIDKYGVRKPSNAISQKNFKVLVVIISDRLITKEEWEQVDMGVQFLSHPDDDNDYLYNYWEATRGLGSLSMGNLRESDRNNKK